MKLFKRLTAMTLAMVMIVTMLSIGLTSRASIDTSRDDVDVSIEVPETIYLTPGGSTFQYYLAGSSDGTAPGSAAAATGYYSFTCKSFVPKSISVTVTGASASNPPVPSNPSITNNKILSGSISGGAMESATSGVLTWTFTYVIPHTHHGVTRDVTYTSKAYTYVYAPYLGQVGSQRAHTYHYNAGLWIYINPSCNAYAFIAGIHGVSGGTHVSKFTQTNLRTSNDQPNQNLCPIVPGWSDEHVPTGGEYGSITGMSDDAQTYFGVQDGGGIAVANEEIDRKDGNSSTDAPANGATGLIYVDASRYAGEAMSSIPNLSGGWMVFTTHDVGMSRTVDFASTETVNSSPAVNVASNVSFSNEMNNSESSDTHGEHFLYPLTGTVPSATATYSMRVHFSYRASQDVGSGKTGHTYLNFGLNFIMVDKSTLRARVNAAINDNFQAEDFVGSFLDTETNTYVELEPAFTDYMQALKTAATVLGKPDATQEEINGAGSALYLKYSLLKRAEAAAYTATVIHKLPAANGVTYTYNGTEYTAENGYIIITEWASFASASDVTVSPNEFTGYSTTETEQTYIRRRSDIDHNFTYTAKESTIYFDYGDSHIVGGLSNVETVRIVRYGQPYGDLPAPVMDGWKFEGWYETGTTNKVVGTTVCRMSEGTLYLQARWSPYFGGGYGTATEPFLIANMAHLDKIDDATAYQINNGNSGTTGKYYKQTADIAYNASKVPVAYFGGTYLGEGKTITIPSGISVTSSAYNSVFGAVNGGEIRSINVVVDGGLAGSGTSGSSGFFGTLTNAAVDNIHITFNGTIAGNDSGILAYASTNSTITNCSVDLQSGTVPCDAFIGAVTDGSLSNNWVLISNAMDSVKSDTANGTVRVRENVTAAMAYVSGRYIFTGTPSTGWNVQFREADDTVVIDSNTCSPLDTDTGKVYYVCAVKNMEFKAGANGTLTGAKVYQLRQGETVTGLVPTPNEGYSNAGWDISGGANGTLSATSPYSYTMGTLGGTLTAKFSVNHYTIHFDKGTDVPGSVVLPQDMVCSAADPVRFSSSQKPTYPGWTFDTWYSEPGGNGTRYALDSDHSPLSKEEDAIVTVYAHFTQDHYTVSFVTDGSPVSPKSVTYGETIVFPTSTKLGYKNLMWYTDSTFTEGGNLPDTDIQIYSDTTFYAKFSPISYSIVFNAPGASNVPETQIVQYDSGDFIIPANFVPVKGGYEFLGWDTVQNGTGTRYQVTDAIPGNLSAKEPYEYNLYAQWIAKHFNVTWVLGSTVVAGDTVYGKINGSEVNPVTEVVFGDRYIVPTGDITMDTKAFKGWFTAPTGGVPVTNETTVQITDHTSFYAQWDTATYKIAYNGNGGSGSIPQPTLTYGELSYVFPNNPFTRDGFTFTGWNTAADGSGIPYQPGTALTYDLTVVNNATVTLYAQWAGNTFKIHYELFGIGTSPALLDTTNVKMEGAPKNLRSKTTATYNGSTYVFKGWAFKSNDASDFTKPAAYEGGASFALTEDVLRNCDYNLSTSTITLYAIWARKTTVTWDLQGGKFKLINDNGSCFFNGGPVYYYIDDEEGNPVRTMIVDENGTVVTDSNGDPLVKDNILRGSIETIVTPTENYRLPSTDPILDRNVFTAWYTTDENHTGSVVTNDTKCITDEDHTVYARWASNGDLSAKYYTEHYCEKVTPNEYDAPTSVELWAEIGDDVTAVINPPEGFSYVENYGPNVLTGKVVDHLTQPALVLKVYYTRNHYHVTFNANGGTGEKAPIDYAYQETKDLEPNTTIKRTGYTLLGWGLSADATQVKYSDGGSLTMGLADIPLFAIWQIGRYKLTFNNGYGEDISSAMYDYNAPISAPEEAPTRTGYTFIGWDKAVPATMPAEDLTVTATWRVNQYKLTFANGYSGNIFSEDVDFGSTIVAPANPTRTGYTFGGWDKNIPATMPANALTITATWTINSYTLMFKNGYGGEISSESVEFNAPVSAPADPTRTGYTFAGWDKAIPTTMPAENVTITATWTINQYKLTFANGYGGNIFSEDVDFNSTITAPANPTRTGYTFGGWDKNIPATMPANDLTITATWTINSYTLTFKNGYGGEISSESVEYNAPVAAPEDPTRTGYTFAGWDKAIPEVMPAENVTITATWTVNQYKLTFADGYSGNIFSEDVDFGSAITAPANPERTGYTFNGWDQNIPAAMPANALTITATWTPHKYTVLFVGGNGGVGTMDSLTLTYDVPQALPANTFTKTGFSFIGWSVAGQEELIADCAEVLNLSSENQASVTLTAQWSNVAYTLSFDLNGGAANPAPADITTTYGATLTLPSGAGYTYETATESRTFLGWKLNDTLYDGGAPFTMPAGNVTFVAEWSANYYALDALIAQINAYHDADTLPANQANDPRYAENGDFAQLLGSNGMYSWNCFDTTDLEAALADAADSAHRGLPQSAQAIVDALQTALQTALDSIVLFAVDYDVKYSCNHRTESEQDPSNRKYYPACESGSKHSYNSLLALVETLLNEAPADSLYTADSLAELRLAVYGDASQTGLVEEVTEENLKKPAQASLENYVDRLSEMYHTLLILKPADYTNIDWLINEYLPQTKFATMDNLLTYYTAQSVQSLQQYYASIDRGYKITRQATLDGTIYNTLKRRIDNLEANPADYSKVYAQILRIPKGGSYSYPSGDITETEAWREWTIANAGHISEAVDKQFLDTRYEANTVAVLNGVLDSLVWTLNIFSQDTVDGTSEVTYEKRLRSAIDGLVRRTYSVTFMVNDGSDTVFDTTLGHFYGDAPRFPVSNPTLKGYIFQGWSSSPTEFIPVTENSIVTGNMVYYAAWELNAANILFDLNGVEGVAPDSVVGRVGIPRELPDVAGFAPDGKFFAGWSADPNAQRGAMTYTLDKKEDITLYAIWSAVGVRLVGKEGSTTVVDDAKHVIYGLELSVLENDLLATYLDVDGYGTINIVKTAYIGTGTKVQLINNYNGQVEAEYYIVLFGDVDGDGTVTLDDIRAVKGHVSGANEFAEGSAQMTAGDMDGDGVVDMRDAAIMKSLITGANDIDQATRRLI